jgi:hypothetical protein
VTTFDAAASIAALRELMAWMRAEGVVHARVGDVELTLAGASSGLDRVKRPFSGSEPVHVGRELTGRVETPEEFTARMRAMAESAPTTASPVAREMVAEALLADDDEGLSEEDKEAAKLFEGWQRGEVSLNG